MSEKINSKVVGVTYDDPRSGLNRQKIINAHIRPGARLQARLEPGNEHDPNAVALWFVWGKWLFKSEYHMGYMTKTINERMAELLRQGQKIEVTVKEITRREHTNGINILVEF